MRTPDPIERRREAILRVLFYLPLIFTLAILAGILFLGYHEVIDE